MTAVAAPLRRWQWEWPAEPTTPRKARQATRRLLHIWDLDSLADDAETMVSELVTNAISYTPGPVSMALRRTETGVRCEVGDPVAEWTLRPSFPRRHGLRIVLALASRVCVIGVPGGKRVCFELDEPT